MCICASTDCIPESTYTAASAVLVGKEIICFSILEFKLGAQTMPTVESALHLGIIRTTSLKDTMIKNVEGNIKKTRRSAYGRFGGRYQVFLVMG
jgi:hypothetical protein